MKIQITNRNCIPYFFKYYPRALIGNFGVRGKESIAFGALENIE
jgi:hypothetical protein